MTSREMLVTTRHRLGPIGFERVEAVRPGARDFGVYVAGGRAP